MTDCPCCGYQLVHCFREHQIRSFCRHCWQEMPDLTIQKTNFLLKRRSLERTIQHSVVQHLVLAF